MGALHSWPAGRRPGPGREGAGVGGSGGFPIWHPPSIKQELDLLSQSPSVVMRGEEA